MIYAKICSALLRVLRDGDDRERLKRHVAHWGVRVPENLAEPVMVRVVVYCAADESLVAWAKELGGDVGDRRGEARSGLLPLGGVERFLEHPAVNRVELSAKRRLI